MKSFHYTNNDFLNTFNEYIQSIEELKNKFELNFDSKTKEKNEMIYNLKDEINNFTNQMIHTIIGYKDDLLDQIDKLSNNIQNKLKQTLEYQQSIQNKFEKLKNHLNKSYDIDESVITNEFAQVNENATNNIESLNNIYFEFKFQPNLNIENVAFFGNIVEVNIVRKFNKWRVLGLKQIFKL